MSGADGIDRQEEIGLLERALGTIRDVADRALELDTDRLRAELDEALDRLWEGFGPHEETEERVARAIGGAVPEVVRLGHRQVHRTLAALSGELRLEGENAGRPRRIARGLDALEALVAAQIELERWMLRREPLTGAGGATHCEWCGAEYLSPGED